MGRLGKLAAEVPGHVANLIGFDEQGEPLLSDEELAQQFEMFSSLLPNMLSGLDPDVASQIDQMAQQRFQAMDPAIRQNLATSIQQSPAAGALSQALPTAMDTIAQEGPRPADGPEVPVEPIEDERQSETPGATPPSSIEEAQAVSAGLPPPEAASAATPEDAVREVQEEAVQAAQTTPPEPAPPSGIMEPEIQSTRDMARRVLQAAPRTELPQFTGYDVVPNQNLNARDRFGNYYYIDPQGRTFRWIEHGEPGQRLMRVPHLEAGPDVEEQVEQKLIREMSGGGAHIPTDPRERAQWAEQRRQQFRSEMGGPSDAAKQLGLTRLDDVMGAAGGPVYFDRQGRPHALSEEGLQRMSSIDLWRQANPEQAAAYDARTAHRERRMSDPRYLATLRRSYQTAGMTPPEWFQEKVQELSQQDPSFRSKMDAHVVAGQMLQDRGFPEGVNYTDLYNQAFQQLGQQPTQQTPQPATPARPKKPIRPKPQAELPQPDVPKPPGSQPQEKLGAQFFNVAGYRGGLRDKHLQSAIRRSPYNRRGALPLAQRGAPYLGTPTVFNPGRDYSMGRMAQGVDPQNLQKLIEQAKLRSRGRRSTRQLSHARQYRPTERPRYQPSSAGRGLGSSRTFDPYGSGGRPQFSSNAQRLGARALRGGVL